MVWAVFISVLCSAFDSESDAEELEDDVESDETGSGSDEEEAQLQECSPEQLLAMGKKCLAAGDATGAVDCFQDACSIL